MLPATNRGAGMNIGFPDICLTPAGPAMVPIPYPNMAMTAMAAPFSPNVMVSMMPALNMASVIPMTMGDEPGVGSPNMGPGMFTMGNPIVMIDGLPGINLTCPTTGNDMINPIGAVVVPSITNVFYCRATPGVEGGAEPHAPTGADRYARTLGAGDFERLDEESGSATQPGGAGEARMLDGETGLLPIALFTPGLSSRVYLAMQDLEAQGMRALVLDLRGNPGGDLDALLSLLDDFLPRGTVLLRTVDGEGEEELHRARQGDPYTCPLSVLVDGGTASAAELFAGSLKAHGRAVVLGERTYGKASVQRVTLAEDGGGAAAYRTVLRCLLPGGESIEGRGVEPDRGGWPHGS